MTSDSDPMTSDSERDRRDREYAERLRRVQRPLWKRLLYYQAPIRWHLKRLQLGLTLEVGCGIGRILEHLGSSGVGVDTNQHVVAAARGFGHRAFTPEEFASTEWACPGRFDALLLSHVAEHMQRDELLVVLRRWLPFLRSGGRLVLITPQEFGFASDPTHAQFFDLPALRSVVLELHLRPESEYSFPLPRIFGRFTIYNEFVSVSRKD